MRFAAGFLMLAVAAGPAPAHEEGPAEAPAAEQSSGAIAIPPGLSPGSNEMLRTVLANHPDIEVIVSDVIIPPGSQVPRHFHPGEEVVYVIEGSAVHVEEGKPDRVLSAGEAMVIAPEAIHAPIGGPEGARAIVFRIHTPGRPERILVPAPE